MAVAADVTVCPRSLSVRITAVRMVASSSTINTVAMPRTVYGRGAADRILANAKDALAAP